MFEKAVGLFATNESNVGGVRLLIYFAFIQYMNNELHGWKYPIEYLIFG